MNERHFHGTAHSTFNIDGLVTVELDRESKIRIATEMRDMCKRNAVDFPASADSWSGRAAEYQMQIDNLSADVPAGWIDPVAHEIAALEKMRADFLATNDKYLHQRAERIVAQIASIREASAQTV